MNSWIALASGIVTILASLIGLWIWKVKRKPKKPRVTYVEKELVKAKRKREDAAGRGDLFELSVIGADLHDRVSTLNKMENPIKRKDTGKTGKD